MHGRAEHAAWGRLHRSDRIAHSAADAAPARDPDELDLEDARVDPSHLDGSAGAVELPTEEIARAREVAWDVGDPLAGNARDYGDATNGAVREQRC